MLWLLGTICILLGLLAFIAKRIYDRLWKVLDKAGAMLICLDSINNSVRPIRETLGYLNEDSKDLRSRASNLDHLKDIPEILRHLMALRELSHGRRETEHDKLWEWPSVSPREELIKAYGKRRPRSPETVAKEPDQAAPGASASPP